MTTATPLQSRRGHRLRIYDADARIQLRNDTLTHNALAVHEERGGVPLCGMTNRDWDGKKMYYVELGPGPVTCASCARSTK